MTVTGAGSNWANSGNLVIGIDGSGKLTITDSGNVSAGHDDFRVKTADIDIDAGRSEPGSRIEGWKMIEALIKRQLILDGSGMIPSQTGLRPLRKDSARISECYAGRQLRQHGPSLIG